MEPVEDVKALGLMDRKILVDQAMLWPQPDGKRAATAIPFNETLGIFFYRKDLLQESEYPKTWADLVRVSQQLQKDGKVKWGFVGGMKYPHTWFTLLWSFWTNDCDLFAPYNERDNDKLTKSGWKSMLGEKCAREAVEFWWDNINTHKISPPALVSYTRTEADGIFMAGEAFMTMNDTPLYGKYNDPAASKVAGKVAMGKFPLGPSSTKKGLAWRAAWFWAVPKAVSPAQKKLAKELLSWLAENDEVQRDIFKSTAGIPPITRVQAALAKEDPLFVQLKTIADRRAVPHHPGLLLQAVAGSARDLLRRRVQGAHRQARGHRQGPVGGRPEAHEHHDTMRLGGGLRPPSDASPQDSRRRSRRRTRNDQTLGGERAANGD